MTVLINGKQASEVSVFDRGLLYGQSVFETIAVVNQTPRLVHEHTARLKRGCEHLSIPIEINNLNNQIDLISRFFSKSDQVLRITISMGEGGRGYANPELNSIKPNVILSLHDYPKHGNEYKETGITLGLSDVRLSSQRLLAGIKHGNRLEQILARSQCQKHWNEALLCDEYDNVIEGTQSNVVLIKGKQAFTPKLDKCGVDGVMKNWVLGQLNEAGFMCHTLRLSVHDILFADEVFMTNSIIGVWPVKRFEHPSKSTEKLGNPDHTNFKNNDADTQTHCFNGFTVAHALIKQLNKNEIISSN